LADTGDAEIATLIAPRGLIVEHSDSPAIEGPPPVRPGRRGGGADGKLYIPAFASVQAEFPLINTLLKPGFQTRHLPSGPDSKTTGHGSPAALQCVEVAGTPIADEMALTIFRTAYSGVLTCTRWRSSSGQ